MNVLDIDLDFFLADCCELAEKGKRPLCAGHEPWHEDDVRYFMENNLGLSAKNKIPARIFETHDMALCMWRELIRQGRLTVPFSVVHIDAHSDLGIGYPGPGFVLNTVISMKPDMRDDIEKYYAMNELDEANYLLFALGFRYVDELVNIRNPKSRQDMPREILVGEDAILLESFVSRLMQGRNGKEPVIRYKEYSDYTKYNEKRKFDFASLAISPRYAPKEADRLVDVIEEYFACE